MKIFGYNITKEKRSVVTVSYPTYSDALLFGSVPVNGSSLKISAVYRAVDIISDNIALMPIKVKVLNENHKEELPTHALQNVFKTNRLTQFNFMKLLMQSVLLTGNGYAYIKRTQDGTVTELVYLDSKDVQVHYTQNTNSLWYTCDKVTHMKIEPCNMIHLMKNTFDGIVGVSILAHASRSVEIANLTENSADSYFKKGCNLSGILTVQGQLTDEQRKQIRTNWNQAYADGGSGIAVLQGNMDYKPVQMSAADSQMLESRLFNVQDIARFFGISPVLLGDLSHSSYNTIEATQNQFLLHTLQPYITMVEAEFNRKLLKPSEANLSINLDETALLKTDKTAIANYYGTLIDKGILCINEVRKELGYSSIEGGDKHIIAYTDIKQNTINSKDGEKTDSK